MFDIKKWADSFQEALTYAIDNNVSNSYLMSLEFVRIKGRFFAALYSGLESNRKLKENRIARAYGHTKSSTPNIQQISMAEWVKLSDNVMSINSRTFSSKEEFEKENSLEELRAEDDGYHIINGPVKGKALFAGKGMEQLLTETNKTVNELLDTIISSGTLKDGGDGISLPSNEWQQPSDEVIKELIRKSPFHQRAIEETVTSPEFGELLKPLTDKVNPIHNPDVPEDTEELWKRTKSFIGGK